MYATSTDEIVASRHIHDSEAIHTSFKMLQGYNHVPFVTRTREYIK